MVIAYHSTEPTLAQRISGSLKKLRPGACGIRHDLLRHAPCSNPGGDCPHGSNLSIHFAFIHLKNMGLLTDNFIDEGKILVDETSKKLVGIDVGVQGVHANLKTGSPLQKWIGDHLSETPSVDEIHAVLKTFQAIAYKAKGALVECLISALDLVEQKDIAGATHLLSEFEIKMGQYRRLDNHLKPNFDWSAPIP